MPKWGGRWPWEAEYSPSWRRRKWAGVVIIAGRFPLAALAIIVLVWAIIVSGDPSLIAFASICSLVFGGLFVYSAFRLWQEWTEHKYQVQSREDWRRQQR